MYNFYILVSLLDLGCSQELYNECIKGRHTVKSIRQKHRDVVFICRVKFHFVLSQIQTSSKVPRLSKTQEQLVRNSVFGRVLLGAFLLRKYPSFLQSFRAHAKPAKQNLQGPGFDIEIASCAKNRFQIIICGHEVTFS